MGVTLSDLLLQQKLSDEQCLNLISTYLQAAQLALASGLLPDDVYGENLMVTVSGELKWIDFGGFSRLLHDDMKPPLEYGKELLRLVWHILCGIQNADSSQRVVEAVGSATTYIELNTNNSVIKAEDLEVLSNGLQIVFDAVYELCE